MIDTPRHIAKVAKDRSILCLNHGGTADWAIDLIYSILAGRTESEVACARRKLDSLENVNRSA